jgi:hypothetical protein
MPVESQIRSAKLVFFTKWVAINFLGFAALNIIVLPVIGLLIYSLLMVGLLGQTAAWIILLTVCGLVIGILQWRIIRIFINPPSKLWILSAMLGCVIAGCALNIQGYGIGSPVPETSQFGSLNSLILLGVLIGLICSTLQLIIIPVRGYHILAWVAFNGLIGAIVSLASFLSATISQFAIGPVAGILEGLLTGMLWLWMLEDSPKEPANL